ncbi:hypothetical protein ARMGADRAFT_1084866 [Armillaria gallica]|uniref:RNI-like protein n=1 Tax=Armillaria gallica TaxID=47427 RepID=A0A2H3CYY8_ARMGA|nr:hypothetical protein ARMGADRAFT_1084866 [Armillaria gallica]
MPKVDTKSGDTETSFTVSNQGDQKADHDLRGTGKDVKDLTITLSTADHQEKSKRGELIAELFKRQVFSSLTPNLTTLNLNFSGHLDTYSDCLGEKLMTALCSLKSLENFSHNATTSARTDFGLYSLMKLVSSWPNLRTLYLAGDTNGSEDCSKIPHATCALESVTFERCMSNFEKLAPMFAGSANSLKSFEAWTMGIKESSGTSYPQSSFILGELSNAPRLQSINLNGDTDTGGRTRKALALALNRADSFPALRRLSYPGERGTYKTGRGRNVRVHEYENVGAKELEETAKKKGVWAELVSRDLEYKVEGAQRRVGFAAMGRRGYW